VDVESALRDLLTDDRLDVPVRPGAVDVVHSGVRRRRRNRAIVMTASTAIVTVLAVGGAVIAGGPGRFDTVQPGGDERPPTPPADYGKPTPATGPTADNEIAWNAIAYDPAKPFALPGTIPDPAVPWCDPKDVTVSLSEFQGATGSAAGSVIVENDGDPCGLQGSPSVTGYAGDQVIAEPVAADPFVVQPWVALESGQRARSIVQVFGDTSECRGPITRFEVDLGHGTATASADATWAGGGDGVQPRCGTVPKRQRVDHYRVSTLAWTTPGTSPTLPLSNVNVTLGSTPTSVMQGTTIRYQVLLTTNGTELDPCPPFREQLVSLDGTATAYAAHYYVLDCNAISKISASTYRLDMELTMPGDVPPGDYELDWQLPVPDLREGDGPTVQVTAAPPPCQQQQLDITPGRNGAAGGSYYDRVLITNVSAHTCSLRGYPGVQFVDESGAGLPTVPEHDTTRPYETVVLDAHGGVSSFLVAGADSVPPDGDVPCPATKGLLVIAPNLVRQVLVPGTGMNCTDGGIRVYPVVAGPHAMP
jgi:hypothetical protein